MAAAVPSTATTTEALTNGARVLAVFGSESGSTKRLLAKTIKDWQAAGATFDIEVLSGNDVVAKYAHLEVIAKTFDAILVVTCSYGCGEPPTNISQFFDMLVDRATFDEGPLLGVHHAVLGCGSSFYDTFQNCPRLHDKLLGECGSRRLAMRGEIDDIAEESKTEQPHYLRWKDEVFKGLQSLPSAKEPPVCEWSKPEGKITTSMSPSTSCPTDDAPFYLAGAVGALVVLVATAWYTDSLPDAVLHDGGLIGSMMMRK